MRPVKGDHRGPIFHGGQNISNDYKILKNGPNFKFGLVIPFINIKETI